jgi:3-polyprenyl-4-hydroxybenzoate decarboxylase
MSNAPSSAGLAGRHLVLGLSGGIACYKAADLCRELVKAGATVQVVMTEAATQFITPVTLQALSNRPVFVGQWDDRAPNNMAHINLAREADALLVAPASADFIAQLAQGRAGELLPLLALARPAERCPLLLAPAMNREMWAHPATQRNVAQVRADGATVLGPGAGDQACGEVGDGRMLEPAELRDALIAFFQPKLLAGQRVLVTASPTSAAARWVLPSPAPRPKPAPRSPWWPARCTCPRRPVCGASMSPARSRCSTPCCPLRPRTTFSWPPPPWPTGGRRSSTTTRSKNKVAKNRPRPSS